MSQSVARGSTAGLPAWISPQFTQLVEAAPDGGQWLHEIKYDGYRMHARLDRGTVKMLTRRAGSGFLRESCGMHVEGIVSKRTDASLAPQAARNLSWSAGPVSNHGGRELDQGVGSIDVLPEVVEAVGGRALVMVDGGIYRGTDVVKALILGADVVSVGRLYIYGLAAAGGPGVVRLFEILRTRFISACHSWASPAITSSTRPTSARRAKS